MLRKMDGRTDGRIDLYFFIFITTLAVEAFLYCEHIDSEW